MGKSNVSARDWPTIVIYLYRKSLKSVRGISMIFQKKSRECTAYSTETSLGSIWISTRKHLNNSSCHYCNLNRTAARRVVFEDNVRSFPQMIGTSFCSVFFSTTIVSFQKKKKTFLITYHHSWSDRKSIDALKVRRAQKLFL